MPWTRRQACWTTPNFAVLEVDVKGDSDSQQTLLSRALELSEEELRRRDGETPRLRTLLLIHLLQGIRRGSVKRL